MGPFKKNDVVKFRRVVDHGDEKLRMQVLEDQYGNPPRVRVKHLDTGMRLEPTDIYPASELIKVHAEGQP